MATENATNSVVKDSNIQIVSPPSVSNQEVGGGETPYVMPRQTGTGNTRGTQNVTGLITITDPSSGVVRLIMGYSPGDF